MLPMLFVIPATSATSERSFSALHLIKAYLRSTMTQQRLNINNLIILHIHIDRKINLMQALHSSLNVNPARVSIVASVYNDVKSILVLIGLCMIHCMNHTNAY